MDRLIVNLSLDDSYGVYLERYSGTDLVGQASCGSVLNWNRNWEMMLIII